MNFCLMKISIKEKESMFFPLRFHSLSDVTVIFFPILCFPRRNVIYFYDFSLHILFYIYVSSFSSFFSFSLTFSTLIFETNNLALYGFLCIRLCMANEEIYDVFGIFIKWSFKELDVINVINVIKTVNKY